MDATLIAASPSTKNRQQKRDPEMSSSKKGNQWYFGMKAHVGVDAESGLVHTAGVTTGKVHDAKVMHRLIREDDRAVARNHRFGKVRAKVEHVFRVVKCQFGYRKVRYRGIEKNGAQLFALFALANIFLARNRLASA